MNKKIKLQLFPNRFSICKFRSNYTHPKWAENDIFYSITKTEEELSVITLENSVQICADRSDGWRLIKVIVPLDFSMVEIMYSLTEILAVEKISFFNITTYNTDYLLVQEDRVNEAVELLKRKFLFVE